MRQKIMQIHRILYNSCVCFDFLPLQSPHRYRFGGVTHYLIVEVSSLEILVGLLHSAVHGTVIWMLPFDGAYLSTVTEC